MQMTDRHCERVGGVVRRGGGIEAKEQLHHPLHLRLLRAPVADDGALHLGGCVLDDLAARFDGGEHRDAARVPQLQRAARVGRMKQVLDGHAIGAAGRQMTRKLAVNARETLGEAVAGERRDRSAGNKVMSAAVRLHAPEAGALGAGIDAEDSHASASISFSSISKFAQTCCTSSWSSIASNSFSICWASLPVSLT